MNFQLKNGKGIKFWYEKWLVNGCLKDLFPVIFKAFHNKQATVADMIHESNWIGVFKHSVNANEQLEWDLLRRDFGIVPLLTEGDDEIKIFGDNFSTKVCYEAMAGTMEVCSFSKHLWKKTIPAK
ncbi:uncharacterized protein LOC113342129, partial [Papaver somniferum]|uniref:uncharacterized protein LOC113342129 n=1 Tax=Papaver somniferum TaxID=3469 RepID=UPI000E6FEF99